ncbi:MAG: PEP-CTERM sorting domain-containing protein [Synechococcales bacterium]|nr:PEP-CTERM sorting domain-containing protein [Synechococcales bacterium]
MMSFPPSLKQALWVSACALSATLPAAPAQAIAFSESQSEIFFVNFSHAPFSTATSTDTNTFTFTDNDLAIANAEANAIFPDASVVGSLPIIAANRLFNEAFAPGGTSLATASSEASVVGDFWVDVASEPTVFSFDFIGFLDVFGVVDSSPTEQASASATIFWGIFDQTEELPVLLDIFDLKAGLETFSDRDFLSLQTTENIDLLPDLTALDTDFGGTAESARVNFAGSYQRTFTTSRSLRLVEFKQGQATASVPEPSLMLAMGIGGVALLRSRRRTK